MLCLQHVWQMVPPASPRKSSLQARLRWPAERVGSSEENCQQYDSKDPSRCNDRKICGFHGFGQGTYARRLHCKPANVLTCCTSSPLEGTVKVAGPVCAVAIIVGLPPNVGRDASQIDYLGHNRAPC